MMCCLTFGHICKSITCLLLSRPWEISNSHGDITYSSLTTCLLLCQCTCLFLSHHLPFPLSLYLPLAITPMRNIKKLWIHFTPLFHYLPFPFSLYLPFATTAMRYVKKAVEIFQTPLSLPAFSFVTIHAFWHYAHENYLTSTETLHTPLSLVPSFFLLSHYPFLQQDFHSLCLSFRCSLFLHHFTAGMRVEFLCFTYNTRKRQTLQAESV